MLVFSSDLHKFKLETQLKTLIHIVDEKQVAIKDAITIISSLNASQKLLVSEVLKLVKLILTVPATNAVSERSCSTLHRFKFYLRSSITQELLSSYLIIATCKEKVDKIKLVEVANQFYSKMNITFPFKNRYFPRKFTESASTRGDPNIRCSSVETQTC